MRKCFRLFLLAVVLGPAVLGSADPRPLIPRLPASKSSPPLPPGTPVERIVIKFQEGTHVRLRGRALVPQPRTPREIERLRALGLSASQVDADVHAVQALLASSRHARGLARLLTASEETLAAGRSQGEARAGRELADLDLYYQVQVPPGSTQVEVEYLVAALNALASVEIAYAQPPAADAAVDIPPATPNYEGNQGYLEAAPLGIDARYAWTLPGGRGQGIRIVDIEGAWRTTHEDLPALFYQGGLQTTGGSDHGAAVLGVMVAPGNGYGVTGIANLAQAGIEGIAGESMASAITNAAAAVGPGGLVLIEQHQPGPWIPPCTCSLPLCGFVPMEYSQDTFDAIVQATAHGVLVIEAGGNGTANLDDPIYQGRFNRSVRDSGAILVGASGAGDRAPACFTNYGSRIDVHAWGESVTTLGFGDLPAGGGDPDQSYTSRFGGTSAASPIVTGAAADLQGISRAAGRGDLNPFAMRQLLRETGIPQAADTQQIARQIGPLPNLRAAIDRLLNGPQNDARCVSQSVPSTLVTGQSYAVSLTMKNAGFLSWSPIGPQCGAYRLGSFNPANNSTWGRSRVELPAPVAPGGQATIHFTATAPATPGTYNFQWRMVYECAGYFGDPCPNAAVQVLPPPPVADFTFTCTGLSCSFNSAGSAGSGLTYTWTFEDTATGTGSTTAPPLHQPH